ncbi:MAG: UPF0182 family protein [Actinomycetota bacterium]|nr:UPF0182 family protein [Actinomycetota bacterium]
MRPRPAPQPARRRRRAAVIVTVLVILLASNFLAYFYTDVLWFREVGFQSVLWTSIKTQFGVGIAGGLIVGLLVWVNLLLAGRLAPSYRYQGSAGGSEDPFDRYREAAGPYLRWLRLGIAAFVGLLAGLVVAAQWETFLLWANRVPFGASDPQFGRDIGFYVFELPFYDLVLDQIRSALITALVVTLAAHYFHGAIRPERRLAGISSGALAHVSVLLGAIALVRAAQYWLGQYELNFSTRGVVTGASYTDVHAQLPALKLLAVISVISAGLFLVNIWFRRLSLPLGAIGIWILFAFLAGGVWPAAVQRFSVEPQEVQREKPFIERNLAATREAFGLGDVETRAFAATEDLTADDLAANTTLLQNVRLWDPGVLQEAYEQLQAIRPYYTFPDVDIDRYEVGGETRQVLVSAREISLDELPDESRKWSNLHLQYTHGYGVVSSLANQATVSGQPRFLVRDVPGTVAPEAESLQLTQPSIYFGEHFTPAEYSIVKSEQQEIDYPQEEGVARSQYEGEGGVPIGTFFRRLAFAIRESDTNLVLSGLITDESKILYYRNVRDRVLRAAPFLSLDHDPYIAVVDGRLVWILDAYTTSPFYPYSQRFDASDIGGTNERGLLRGDINYIRNSVKVVVDAYDGTMDFYIVDPDDPVIEAWRGAFPALFTDDAPSDNLRSHFRYPEDLFELQTEVFLSYHIEDPEDFYAHEDEWAIPVSPTSVPETTAIATTTSDTEVAPTYLLIRLPQEEDQEFLLTRPVTPRGKNNMVAILVARSDPEGYGEFLTLQFPRQFLVEGPSQVHNLINQDVEFSRERTLLGREGSEITFGSLVTLPIEDAILYVQPIFITAENLGIPELKRVVLVLGEEVALGETFDDALSDLFGTDADTQDVVDRPDAQPPDRGGDGGRPDPRLRELVERAGRLYERAQAALAAGDFERYGELIERLGRLLRRAERLSS